MELSMAEFRNDMATPINKVVYGGERLVLTRKGRGTVALVSLDDLALLEKLEDEIDVREAKKVLAEMKRTGDKGIPWEQVKAELGWRGLGHAGANSNGHANGKAKPYQVKQVLRAIDKLEGKR